MASVTQSKDPALRFPLSQTRRANYLNEAFYKYWVATSSGRCAPTCSVGVHSLCTPVGASPQDLPDNDLWVEVIFSFEGLRLTRHLPEQKQAFMSFNDSVSYRWQSDQGNQNDSKETGSSSESGKLKLCQDAGHQPRQLAPAHVHTERSTQRQMKYLLGK